MRWNGCAVLGDRACCAGCYFQDRQVRGPFAVWIHDHIYESTDGGGTKVTDRFTYSAPLGPLGRIAERLWLHKRLSKMMEHFQEAEKRILEQNGS